MIMINVISSSLSGEGIFSTVSCVRHRLDGTLYAIKRLKENINSEKQGISMMMMMKEMMMMMMIEMMMMKVMMMMMMILMWVY